MSRLAGLRNGKRVIQDRKPGFTTPGRVTTGYDILGGLVAFEKGGLGGMPIDKL
jgi:hypothetical protein